MFYSALCCDSFNGVKFLYSFVVSFVVSICTNLISDEKEEKCCNELVLASDAEKQRELANGFPFLLLCRWLKNIS